jgi:uncharacterized membrane protein
MPSSIEKFIERFWSWEVITLEHSENKMSDGAGGRTRTLLYAIAALLSLTGLADAIYLTVEHLMGETATCVVTRGCAEVLGSKYATVGKVPLAALGALAYFTAFSLATLAAFGYRRAAICLMFLVQAIFAVTLWLLLVQAFVLHAFCDYCLFSAAVTLLLTGLVATLLLRTDGVILHRLFSRHGNRVDY